MSAQGAGMEHYLDAEERDSRRVRPENLKLLIHQILAHPLPLVLGATMLLLGTSAALLEPRIFGNAVDLAIIPKDWLRLKQIGILYLLVVVVRVMGAMGQAYFFETLGQRIAQDLRCKIFSHLLRLPASAHDKNPVGRLMTRVTNDVASLTEMFSAGFVSMVGNALLIIGILIWLLVLDLRLGLLSLAVFPLLVGMSAFFSGRLKVAYREARGRLSALNTFFAENLLGIKIVHLFNRQALHLERFDRINNWYADAQISSVKIFAMFQPAITIASGIAVAWVIWLGGMEARNGLLPVGVLIAYFSYVLTLFQPIREVADKWNIFLSGMASAERIFSVLSWPVEQGPEEVESPAIPIPGIRGEIIFENVWFAYSGEHWVLRDFSLSIPAGTRLGVVGHTGAGKTTLIGLLMRFYDPQKGRILLDGRDLREYRLRDLRATFGLIQQDGFLFTGSIEDNMTFWSGRKPDAAPLPMELMNQEELRERATNISAGQRQVLAFARAFSARPKIWILDEATANMDSSTEKKLQANLEAATESATAILIAHRLSTIRSCHVIVVLHKGVLVEKGSHVELLGADGLYARLYRYQAVKEAQESHLVK